MRFAPGLLFSLLVIGCGSSSNETCSMPVTCAAGSYRACTSGLGSSCNAHYETSDGKRFACSTCTCADAATAITSWCSGQVSPDLGTTVVTGGRAACDRYLTCAAAVTPAALPGLQQGYGASGTCWQSTAAAQQMCIDACTAGLTQLRVGAQGNAACGCDSDSQCPSKHCDATTQQCVTPEGTCDVANACGCNGYEICYDKCNGVQTCEDKCGKNTTQQGLDLDFQLFTGCPMRYCNAHSTTGVLCTATDLDPHATANITQACNDCISNLNWDSTTFMNNCRTEQNACTADKP
jgi:hypothetical protein